MFLLRCTRVVAAGQQRQWGKEEQVVDRKAEAAWLVAMASCIKQMHMWAVFECAIRANSVQHEKQRLLTLLWSSHTHHMLPGNADAPGTATSKQYSCNLTAQNEVTHQELVR
jgi:hypothetical protein